MCVCVLSNPDTLLDRTLATSDHVSHVRHTNVPAMNSSLPSAQSTLGCLQPGPDPWAETQHSSLPAPVWADPGAAGP